MSQNHSNKKDNNFGIINKERNNINISDSTNISPKSNFHKNTSNGINVKTFSPNSFSDKEVTPSPNLKEEKDKEVTPSPNLAEAYPSNEKEEVSQEKPIVENKEKEKEVKKDIIKEEKKEEKIKVEEKEVKNKIPNKNNIEKNKIWNKQDFAYKALCILNKRTMPNKKYSDKEIAKIFKEYSLSRYGKIIPHEVMMEDLKNLLKSDK